jgi:hypothetical protein
MRAKEQLGDSLRRNTLNQVNENHPKQFKNDIKEANESSWTVDTDRMK